MSQQLINADQFYALVKLMRGDPKSASNLAAKGIMVDGRKRADVIQEYGCTRSTVSDAIKRYTTAHDIIKVAYEKSAISDTINAGAKAYVAAAEASQASTNAIEAANKAGIAAKQALDAGEQANSAVKELARVLPELATLVSEENIIAAVERELAKTKK